VIGHRNALLGGNGGFKEEKTQMLHSEGWSRGVVTVERKGVRKGVSGIESRGRGFRFRCLLGHRRRAIIVREFPSRTVNFNRSDKFNDSSWMDAGNLC